MLQAWTDYPIAELGDQPGVQAPVRECTVLSYDGDKYCRISVSGIQTEVKSGYLYAVPGRSGEVKNLRYRALLKLHPKMRRPRGKPASCTVSYYVYEPDYRPGKRYVRAKSKIAALKWCRKFGNGSDVVRNIHKVNRNGVSSSYTDEVYTWSSETKRP